MAFRWGKPVMGHKLLQSNERPELVEILCSIQESGLPEELWCLVDSYATLRHLVVGGLGMVCCKSISCVDDFSFATFMDLELPEPRITTTLVYDPKKGCVRLVLGKESAIADKLCKTLEIYLKSRKTTVTSDDWIFAMFTRLVEKNYRKEIIACPPSVGISNNETTHWMGFGGYPLYTMWDDDENIKAVGVVESMPSNLLLQHDNKYLFRSIRTHKMIELCSVDWIMNWGSEVAAFSRHYFVWYDQVWKFRTANGYLIFNLISSPYYELKCALPPQSLPGDPEHTVSWVHPISQVVYISPVGDYGAQQLNLNYQIVRVKSSTQDDQHYQLRVSSISAQDSYAQALLFHGSGESNPLNTLPLPSEFWFSSAQSKKEKK